MDSAHNVIPFPRPEIPAPPPPLPRREKRKEVCSKDIINKINSLHFAEESILLYFRHKKFGTITTIKATPEACLCNTVTCLIEPSLLEGNLNSDNILSAVILSDTETSFLITPEDIHFYSDAISFRVPDTAVEFTHRQKVRHQSSEVTARIVANGIIFDGTLVNFTDTSLNVRIQQKRDQSFRWMGHDNNLFLMLESGGTLVFSADCRIIKQLGEASARTLILSPQPECTQRFRKRKYRSSRQKLLPSPQVIFIHPLTGRKTKHRIANISGSGFALEENSATSTLIRGLKVEMAEIVFSNSFRLSCTFQVIQKTVTERHSTAGCAILDMNVDSHVDLMNMLHQAGDINLSICCEDVDTEKLWEFFFKTGFIYQQKYAFVSQHKEAFKKLYERLYSSNPHIARHFIIEENSTIQAHMSMIRVYDKTWMIHHHAALKTGNRRNGIEVLNHLNRSIIGCDNLASSKMDYICCYYRGENKFPNRVFGGVVKHIGDPEKASTDKFGYLQYRKTAIPPAFSPGCELVRSSSQDIYELQSFYRCTSGGLLLDAMNIEWDQSADTLLSQEYGALNFRRSRIFMSFKKSGVLKAICILNISDIGINMSDFTNCIQVFVIDADGLTQKDFQSMLHVTAFKFNNDPVTALVYPANFLVENAIHHDKIYNFFAIATDYADEYFDHLVNVFPSIGL